MHRPKYHNIWNKSVSFRKRWLTFSTAAREEQWHQFYEAPPPTPTLKPQNNIMSNNNNIAEYKDTAIEWLVHWPLMGGLLHLVQRGGAWAGLGLPSPLLAVPNVTAHPSTASAPTSHYLMWHYNCLCTLNGWQYTVYIIAKSSSATSHWAVENWSGVSALTQKVHSEIVF